MLMLHGKFAIHCALCAGSARAAQLSKSAGLRPQKSRDLALHTPAHPTLEGAGRKVDFSWRGGSRDQPAPFTVRFVPGLLGLASYLTRPASDFKSRAISPLHTPPHAPAPPRILPRPHGLRPAPGRQPNLPPPLHHPSTTFHTPHPLPAPLPPRSPTAKKATKARSGKAKGGEEWTKSKWTEEEVAELPVLTKPQEMFDEMVAQAEARARTKGSALEGHSLAELAQRLEGRPPR